MGADELALEKVPPQNLEAEQSVLGSMLLDEEAIVKAVEILDEDSFYKEVHRRIFSAVLELYEKGEAVDLITLTEQLKKEKALDMVGGASYITSLIDMVPTAANAEYYANIVKEKATLRSLINAATQIITGSYEDPKDVDLFLDKAEAMVFNISQRKVRQDFVPLKDMIHHSVEKAEELFNRKELVTGVPSGFMDLDRRTSGFQPSELIIIAGRPSMGKTAFSLNVAQHVTIKMKIPVAIFSLEMSREQLVQRLLCSEARVELHKLRTGYLSASAFPRLASAAGRLAEAPIFIDDTGDISALELRAKARRIQAREKVGLIIIDYLQLMRGRRSDSRQQEISEISRALKNLTKELNIPILAVSQLSREVEKRGRGARPQLSDLRESGAIEQDADLVAFIHRKRRFDDVEEKGLEGDVAEIIIGKQRHGPVGTIKLTFLEKYTRFENLSTRAE